MNYNFNPYQFKDLLSLIVTNINIVIHSQYLLDIHFVFNNLYVCLVLQQNILLNL